MQQSADLMAHKQSLEASAGAREKVADILHSELHTSLEAGLKRGISADQRSAAGIQSQSFLERLTGFATVQIMAPKVGKDLDPQATRLALHTGWKKDTAQEVASLTLGGLLLILGSLAVRMGVQDWPIREPRPILIPTRPKVSRPTLTLVPKGLSRSDLVTLEVLKQNQAYPLKNVEVATLMDISQGEANRRVARLVKKGLVEKVKCGREVQITLAIPGRIPAPPRKFGDYFKVNQSRESAVKPRTDNVMSMTA